MSLVGEPYLNAYTGEVEEVVWRHPFEALGLCSRCLGIVESPSETGGVYTCCGCGLKFVVEAYQLSFRTEGD